MQLKQGQVLFFSPEIGSLDWVSKTQASPRVFPPSKLTSWTHLWLLQLQPLHSCSM